MPREHSTLLRIAVPIVLLAGAIGVGYAVMRNTTQQASKPLPSSSIPTPSTAASPPASATAQPPAAQPSASDSATSTPAPPLPAPVASLTADAPAPKNLRAQPWPTDTPQDFSPLGDTTPSAKGGTARMRVAFSPVGAGIDSITMADHFLRIGPGADQVVVQQAARVAANGRTLTIVPFSLLGLTIDGAFVNLAASPDGPLWRQTAPGAFEAQIVDAGGAPVARVTRVFDLVPGTHELALDQTLHNLSAAPLAVQWVHMGPVDPPSDSHNASDLRRVRFAYLSAPAVDPEQKTVLADTRFLMERSAVLGDPAWNGALGRFEFPTAVLWPDPRGRSDRLSLAWVAATNHYFAAALHAAPDRVPPRTDTPSGSALDKRLHAGATIDRIAITSAEADAAAATRDARFGLRLSGPITRVAPGATDRQALGVYAGPMDRTFAAHPAVLREMGMGELVVYYLGGPCAWCMFQPVAATLHWYLQVLHDYVVFDWSLAIVLLVLTLRTLLHPMTKWSQRGMIVMGKKMSALAPKQKKLQERFAGDPKRLREEQAKLMQEEGVGASSIMGCAPMFVQMLVNTPIWIGLSGAIFTAFALRHDAALFGVFQHLGNLVGVHWPFLADLSDQDRFIPLPFKINLWIIHFDAINILPPILGLVFFFQQKYLTPPPTTQLTPEQEQQQRIMKIMMVVLFPVMMYNQPAALVLYFAVNSIFGSLEAAHIRKQFEKVLAEREARGDSPLKRKATSGTPGFFERIRQRVEEAQKLREQQAKQSKRTR